MEVPQKRTVIELDVIYGLNDKPPLAQTLVAALQHLFAILVPIITPPLIICGALGMDVQTTRYLVSMALIASGISTFIQVRRIGPFGSGLLSIQGTSFSFVNPIIKAGRIGGLPLILGVCMAGSVIEMVLSRFLRLAKKLIPPLVSGIVVTLIGITLIKVGIENCAGGAAARVNGTFGSVQNLVIAALVLGVIVLLNRSRNNWLRMSAILVGLVVGYIMALVMGMVDFGGLKETEIFALPTPFKYGISFNPGVFFPIAIIYVVTTIESIGDITATSVVSGEPIEGDLYLKRVSGGVLGDGFNSLLAGVLNSFPNTTFSQNNGMIQLTGIASRYVGYYIAGFLTLLGLFPIVATIFSLIPAAVLGSATLIMFGTIAGAGIKIMASAPIDRRAILIMALSFGIGLGVAWQPDIFNQAPEIAKHLFSSGIAAGGVTAFLMNLVLPPTHRG